MGYSCCTSAANALDFILDQVTDSLGSSNSWQNDGNDYFFERGREQADGSITGTVYRMIGENRCRKAGSAKIDPDGLVRRFPNIPAHVRENARLAYESGDIDNYHAQRCR